MKKTRALIIVLLCCIVLSSCGGTEASKGYDIAESEEMPEKLVVYLSGPMHGFQSADDENGENIEYLYPSKYTVGTRLIGGELDCSGGNVFEQALVEYSQKTGIEIEVHYIEEYAGETDVLQHLYEQNDLPDMVILNKYSQYDYYLLAKQGVLLDFSPYMEEELHDEALYYQKVMDGGKVQDQQVVLPVRFNMSGLITSKSYLASISLSEPDSDLSFQDVVYLLEKSCVEMESDQRKEAIFESSGLMLGGTYIPSILTGAAYADYFDEDVNNVELSSDVIKSILEVMSLYNRQEFGIDPDWQEKKYIDNLNNADIMSRSLTTLTSDTYRYVGIFLSGGRSGGINLHNSLLLDAAYFHSMYQQSDEEMVFCGIPTADGARLYSANISVLAAGFSSTKYPRAVYELARYMMDYDYPMAYGFSANKQITANQLDRIQKTSTSLYSDTIWSAVTAGVKTREELQSDIEVIEPLDAESVEKIRNMLDNLGGAGLPCGVLEYMIYLSALHKIGDGDMSCSEASEWVIDTLKEYLTVSENLDPFYDKEFITSMIESRFE